jgi:hypothetical protein
MPSRILAVLLLLTPLPAAAQDDVPADAAQDEDEGTICIGVATLWRGDSADIRAIERIPVPQGFRRLYEFTGPCNSLMPESLVDWQLRFGSERSATAALAYLERGRSRVIRTPEQHSEQLELAWQAAQGDLARARELDGADASHRASGPFIWRSEPIRRFLELADGADSGYLFLAEQYLRLAEAYRSLTLLEKAEGFFATDLASVTFVSRFDEESLEGRLFNRPSYLRLKADDVEMRAAVLRARLTRTNEALARTETVIGAKNRPYYRDLAEYAFTGGDDFCDMSVGADETVRSECRHGDEPNTQERLFDYLASRASLDLVRDDAATLGHRGAFTAMMRLLAEERRFDGSRCCRGRTNAEATVDLSLGLAEYYGRRTPNANELEDNEPLSTLAAAEQVVPPYEDPNGFRRIAQAWLTRYRQAVAGLAAEDRRRSFDDARHAAYLERTLASLPAIARSD